MTPNFAQGANCSIEDAASLANKLHEVLQANKCVQKPSDQQIEHLLRQFNATQIARMSKIYKASRMVVRLQTGNNILFRMILRYYVPYAGNVPSERAMKILENAMVLQFIPLPQRSGPRWLLPGKKEMDALSWAGIMAASPLLALALFFVTRLWQLENQAPF
jgi:salicylate hydroxylase/FAD dependent monooxygenase